MTFKSEPPTKPGADNRFWGKVEKSKSCWNWTGSLSSKGYGHFWLCGSVVRAHRHSYKIHYGEPPIGAFICHHCDNPKCVNPDHLYAGTPKSNMEDCVRRKRLRFESGVEAARDAVRPNARRGESSHHAKLTPDQVRDVISGANRGVFYARLYGVSEAAISKIRVRKSWRHISSRAKQVVEGEEK